MRTNLVSSDSFSRRLEGFISIALLSTQPAAFQLIRFIVSVQDNVFCEVYEAGQRFISKIPSHMQLLETLLKELQGLGGSGSIEEICDKVAGMENFAEAVLSPLHDPAKLMSYLPLLSFKPSTIVPAAYLLTPPFGIGVPH